ncbi:MAG: rpmD [Cytophagaceae bacterium]|jgi:large subunit ribosomal protein L30|nr:rpmD [Cytophagaceae bacterium]
MSKIKITQVKSAIKRPAAQKRVLESLGLGKIHQTVEHTINPQIQGMINKVIHMVEVEK